MGLIRDTTKEARVVANSRMEEGTVDNPSKLAKITQTVEIQVLKVDPTIISHATMITIREVATRITRRTMGIGAIIPTATEATVAGILAITLRCLMSPPMVAMGVERPKSSSPAEHQGPIKLVASLHIRRTRVDLAVVHRKEHLSNLSKIAPKISHRDRLPPLTPSLRAKHQG